MWWKWSIYNTRSFCSCRSISHSNITIWKNTSQQRAHMIRYWERNIMLHKRISNFNLSPCDLYVNRVKNNDYITSRRTLSLRQVDVLGWKQMRCVFSTLLEFFLCCADSEWRIISLSPIWPQEITFMHILHRKECGFPLTDVTNGQVVCQLLLNFVLHLPYFLENQFWRRRNQNFIIIWQIRLSWLTHCVQLLAAAVKV